MHGHVLIQIPRQGVGAFTLHRGAGCLQKKWENMCGICHTLWCPKSLAKLVDISPITMVYS